ncbi:hypothetical protein CSHISOI_00967 [Colletotrichum shisoi]|uniref:Uncharacterized protein n=1 Tax=Colletotrichum shisoi TaxID=2078593 RepID=A0A5Q4C7C2_9PEZI|nr:hypothetical protein CSHISOI_00967 [Colletotrichum shisoi]
MRPTLRQPIEPAVRTIAGRRQDLAQLLCQTSPEGRQGYDGIPRSTPY